MERCETSVGRVAVRRRQYRDTVERDASAVVAWVGGLRQQLWSGDNNKG